MEMLGKGGVMGWVSEGADGFGECEWQGMSILYIYSKVKQVLLASLSVGTG